MSKKREYGLLIDYEYCTACHACEVACAQEHKWPVGSRGIKVTENVQVLPSGKASLTYIPTPTELCIGYPSRTKKGQSPACVHHCMANCMTYGRIDVLAKDLTQKAMLALWVPN